MPRRIAAGSGLKRLAEHCRNLLLSVHVAEYAGLNLQIIVQKNVAGDLAQKEDSHRRTSSGSSSAR
jgi:hypothetical protein